MVGTPLVSYDPSATQRLSARKPTKNANEASVGFAHEDESDEVEDEDEEDEGDEESNILEEQLAAALLDERRKIANEYQQLKAQQRALALKAENDRRQAQNPPPPPPPQSAPSSGPKYSMRTYDKAATKITYGTRNDYDHEGVRNMPKGMNTNVLSGGSPWERRQSFASNADQIRSSAYPQHAGGNPKVAMNDPKWPPRRMSYMGGESLDEIREIRAKQQLENFLANHLTEVPQGPTIQDRRASLNPEIYNRLAGLNQDEKLILESQLQNAMEYQRQMDALRNRFAHVESTPLTAKSLRHHIGLPYEAEPRSTSRSNASNDGTARISAGHRIKAVPERGTFSTSGDEIKMRIDMRKGFEAEIEGRRISVNPTGEDSIAELVMGSKRENTSYYGTSKGSVTTESRLGRSTSVREKAARQVERERERDRGRERERERRHDRSRQHEDEIHEDDEQSSSSDSNYPTTRTKRAGTYTSGRRAAEEQQSETERPKKGHRRTKTSDSRYAAGPSSPTRGRGKKPFLG
jgi:hypothetical protein